MIVKCFMLLPANLERAWLRRFADGPCPKMPSAMGYHNGMFHVGDVTPEHYEKMRARDLDKTDVNWPRACACGYEFKVDDSWQLFGRELFRNAITGELHTEEDAPPGAMWYAPRYSNKDFEGFYDSSDFNGLPEAERALGHLHVKLPDGVVWDVDSKANNGTNGSGWTRTGAVPAITARPSILTGSYHGWLTNGILTPC